MRGLTKAQENQHNQKSPKATFTKSRVARGFTKDAPTQTAILGYLYSRKQHHLDTGGDRK